MPRPSCCSFSRSPRRRGWEGRPRSGEGVGAGCKMLQASSLCNSPLPKGWLPRESHRLMMHVAPALGLRLAPSLPKAPGERDLPVTFGALTETVGVPALGRDRRSHANRQSRRRLDRKKRPDPVDRPAAASVPSVRAAVAALPRRFRPNARGAAPGDATTLPDEPSAGPDGARVVSGRAPKLLAPV